MAEKMRGGEVHSQLQNSEQAELDRQKLFVSQEFEKFKKQVLKKINQNLRTWGDKEKYSEVDFEKFAVAIGDFENFLNPKDHELFNKNLEVVKKAIAEISGKFIGVEIDQETFVPFKPKNIEKIRSALKQDRPAKFDDEIVSIITDESGSSYEESFTVNGVEIAQMQGHDGSDQKAMDFNVGIARLKRIEPKPELSANQLEGVPKSSDELLYDFYKHLIQKMIEDKKIDKKSPEYHKIPQELLE